MSGESISWRVLQAPTVSTHRGPVGLKSKSRAVLLKLLLADGRSVPTERIVDFLWGDEPPKTARNSIARFIADLRSSLGPFGVRIITDDIGYRADVREGEFDLRNAQVAISRARESAADNDDDGSHGFLELALDLLGSEPNPGLMDLAEADSDLRAHEELRIETLHRFAEVQLRRGEHESLIPRLTRAVDEHPYHEELWALLMISLDRSGRLTEALRTGQRVRETLADVGSSPGSRVSEIERSILDRTDDRARPNPQQLYGPIVDNSREAHGVGEPTTPLVGRARELADLTDALTRHRHVTITGLGGIGKTRLALAVARAEHLNESAVYRIGLRTVTDPELLVPTIAVALGITPMAGSGDLLTLVQLLSRQSFLLVLDNCEHLLEACAELVDALYELAPMIRILATSRHALGSANELVYQLGPLAVPDPDDASAESASVSLFIDRSTDHLDLDVPNQQLLGQLCAICHSLGGVPLAIELAAAQMAEISPSTLLARVGTSPLEAVERVIEWSWGNLTPAQQVLLSRLSVLGGGWTADAAAAVCSESQTVGDDVAELVKQSLVVPIETDNTERFEMLEPVRKFAEERLDERAETEIVKDRLVRWVLDLSGDHTITEHHAYAHLSQALEPEHSNIIRALAHLQGADRSEELAQVALHTTGFWINHGFADQALRWLLPLVDDPALSRSTHCAVLSMLTAAHHTLGNLEEIAPTGMRALEEAGDELYEWLTVLTGYFGLWSLLSPMDRTDQEFYELSLETAEASPARELNLAIAAMYRGHVEYAKRDYDRAVDYFRDARARLEHPGRVLVIVEVGEALALFTGGRRAEALVATESWRSVPHTDQWHYTIEVVRAIVAGGTGDPHKATADLAATVRNLPPAGIWGRSGEIQLAFGLLAYYRGEPELSAELLATARSRDTLLIGTCIEHIIETRGIESDEGWLEIASDFWSRVLPSNVLSDRQVTTPELLSRWGARP